MAEEIKKFYRSRTDRVLFGVCGGLGRYFNVDPVLFRLLFILLFFIEGAGLLLYVIMVFVTPEEPKIGEENREGLGEEVKEFADKVEKKVKDISKEAHLDENKASDSRNALGIAIVLVGLFFLSREILPMAWLSSDIIWALVIIGIGFYIIFKR